MKIQFFDAKKGTVEWVLSTTVLNVFPTDGVRLHMSKVVSLDKEKREKVFCQKNPVKGFFWTHPAAIVVVGGLFVLCFVYIGGIILSSTGPAGVVIKKMFFSALLLLVLVGTPWFMWRSDMPLLPEAEARQWEKVECVECPGNLNVLVIHRLIEERSLADVQVFVHTHPSVPERWYSISGPGDSGNQVEYFFSSSSTSSLV